MKESPESLTASRTPQEYDSKAQFAAAPSLGMVSQMQLGMPVSLHHAQQTKLQSTIAASPQVQQLHQLQSIANAAHTHTHLFAHAPAGGLPTQLQSSIESLSGIAMHDVRVHYNSSKPAQLQAHAYAQGTDIHLAPGQEKHLPHEAWHVVQQKQGRVKPTLQLKGVAINDDSALEREADVMGARAMLPIRTGASAFAPLQTSLREQSPVQAVMQRALAADRLNIAGENHNESDPRRGREAKFVADEIKGGYWTEEQFQITVNTDSGQAGNVSADPLLLQWFHGVHFAETVVDKLRTQCLAITSANAPWTLATFKTVIRELDGVLGNLNDLFGTISAKTSGERALHNAQCNISTMEKVIACDATVTAMENARAAVVAAAQLAVTAANSQEEATQRTTVRSNFRVTDQLASLMQSVATLQAAKDYNLGQEAISGVRSLNMAVAGQDYSTRIGVWKIGEAHRQHISGTPNRKFNLLTRQEFNDLYDVWDAKQG